MSRQKQCFWLETPREPASWLPQRHFAPCKATGGCEGKGCSCSTLPSLEITPGPGHGCWPPSAAQEQELRQLHLQQAIPSAETIPTEGLGQERGTQRVTGTSGRDGCWGWCQSSSYPGLKTGHCRCPTIPVKVTMKNLRSRFLFQ